MNESNNISNQPKNILLEIQERPSEIQERPSEIQERPSESSRITLIVLTVLASLACVVAIALTTLAHLEVLTLIANPVILPVIIGVSLLAAIIFGCCASCKTKDNFETKEENPFAYRKEELREDETVSRNDEKTLNLGVQGN